MEVCLPQRRKNRFRHLAKGLEEKIGRLEGWKIGRLEDWKIGRLEGWKAGRGKGGLII